MTKSRLTNLLTGAVLIGSLTHAIQQRAAAAEENLFEIPLKTITGDDTTLQAYEGKTLLIVNVASKCGLTPQYEALQALQEKYGDEKFTVLGFPCNDFLGQEPGSPEEIVEFCTTNYNVTFPLFEKIKVLGPNKHPLYAELTGEGSPLPGPIEWNFGKFLIGKDGAILNRFKPGVVPDSKEVVSAIEADLNSKSPTESAPESDDE